MKNSTKLIAVYSILFMILGLALVVVTNTFVMLIGFSDYWFVSLMGWALTFTFDGIAGWLMIVLGAEIKKISAREN